MKKLQFLVCFLLLSVASYAADRTIQLPKPDMNRAGLLMKALSERHSTREYASKALSNTDLSDLLWAANGINRSSEGKRTAPSARIVRISTYMWCFRKELTCMMLKGISSI